MNDWGDGWPHCRSINHTGATGVHVRCPLRWEVSRPAESGLEATFLEFPSTCGHFLARAWSNWGAAMSPPHPTIHSPVLTHPIPQGGALTCGHLGHTP